LWQAAQGGQPDQELEEQYTYSSHTMTNNINKCHLACNNVLTSKRDKCLPARWILPSAKAITKKSGVFLIKSRWQLRAQEIELKKNKTVEYIEHGLGWFHQKWVHGRKAATPYRDLWMSVAMCQE